MDILNSLNVNWFVLISSALTAVILYLIIFKIPDEEPETAMETKTSEKKNKTSKH